MSSCLDPEREACRSSSQRSSCSHASPEILDRQGHRHERPMLDNSRPSREPTPARPSDAAHRVHASFPRKFQRSRDGWRYPSLPVDCGYEDILDEVPLGVFEPNCDLKVFDRGKKRNRSNATSSSRSDSSRSPSFRTLASLFQRLSPPPRSSRKKTRQTQPTSRKSFAGR